MGNTSKADYQPNGKINKSEFRDRSIFGCTKSLNIPRFSSDLGINYYCLHVDLSGTQLLGKKKEEEGKNLHFLLTQEAL